MAAKERSAGETKSRRLELHQDLAYPPGMASGPRRRLEPTLAGSLVVFELDNFFDRSRVRARSIADGAES